MSKAIGLQTKLDENQMAGYHNGYWPMEQRLEKNRELLRADVARLVGFPPTHQVSYSVNGQVHVEDAKTNVTEEQLAQLQSELVAQRQGIQEQINQLVATKGAVEAKLDNIEVAKRANAAYALDAETSRAAWKARDIALKEEEVQLLNEGAALEQVETVARPESQGPFKWTTGLLRSEARDWQIRDTGRAGIAGAYGGMFPSVEYNQKEWEDLLVRSMNSEPRVIEWQKRFPKYFAYLVGKYGPNMQGGYGGSTGGVGMYGGGSSATTAASSAPTWADHSHMYSGPSHSPWRHGGAATTSAPAAAGNKPAAAATPHLHTYQWTGPAHAHPALSKY